MACERLVFGWSVAQVNVYLLEGRNGVTVIDAGFWSSGPRILRALAGRPVERILLTHFHPDHAGSAAFLSRVTGAPIMLHPADHSYAAAVGALEPGSVWWRREILLRAGRWLVPPARYETLRERAGDLHVLHTPGHTPGSCSFWDEARGLLFTGDTLVNNWSFGFGFGGYFLTAERKRQCRSLDRYRELGARRVLTGHGPPWEGDLTAWLRDRTAL